MLGHVAQSIGGALPGGLSVNPLVRQVLLVTNGQTVTVQDGEAFAFVEALGHGGQVSGSSAAASGGGAGNDAIVAVSPGSSFSFVLPSQTGGGSKTSSISYAGSTVISVAGAIGQSGAGLGVGASGKYPGSAATNTTTPGRGGGRLAGAATTGSANEGLPSGDGSGIFTLGGATLYGGRSIGCLTFFRSYDAALAFANSLYGGNWQP